MSAEPPIVGRLARALSAALVLFALAGPARAQRAPNRVQKLEAREDGSRTIITIHGTATPTFTVYKLEKPERVVVDVANAELGLSIDGPVAVNTWAVGQLSAQALGEEDAAVTRVVVTFARPSTYQVKAQGQDVVMVVSPREPKPAADEASRADADKARAETDKARAAQAEADRAKADADRAKADANKAKAEAEQARQQAEQARQQAEAKDAQAQEKLRAADERMKQADARVKEADARAADAEKKRADAERAASEADERAKKAEAAGSADAADKRKQAEKAAAQADARRKEAEQKRKQAEDAAAQAEAKRQQAEDAAAQADKKRADAEQASRTADAERDRAKAEKADAEQARDRAKAEEAQAEKARAQAEQARAQAVEARKAEEERARVVADKRQEEEQRAKAAAEARAREEAAAKKAADMRAEADARRADAEAALAKVEARRAEAEKAATAADARRKESEAAAAEADRVARQKGQESDEYKAAEARAVAAKKKRDQADADLKDKRAALASEQQRAEQAEGERDQAVAEAKKAKDAAEKARADRQSEEQKKAEVQKQREAEESRLAQAKQARLAEEKRLAVAEQKRKQAEAEADRAEKDRVVQEHQAKAEEARADRAKAEQAKAERARAEAAKPAPAAPAAPVAVAAAKPASAPAAKPAPAPVAPPAPTSRAGVRVANVDYVDRDDTARVVVQLSGPGEPKLLGASGRQAILTIPGADIPAGLERSLDTSEFEGPVTAISSYRDPRDPTQVRIVVDLSEPADSKLVRSGNTWYWDFKKPAGMAKRNAAKKPVAGKATAYEPPVVGGYGAASTPVTSQTVAQKKKVYRGKRIELDFKDADIHNVLRVLAQVGDVDVVIPDDVKGTVTVRLTDVPWDQAMEVILQSKGLWYRREGRLIRVALRKDLDAEDEEERARKAAMVQAEAPEPVIFTLNYSVAKTVAEQAKSLLSAKGKIEVDDRTNSLIINDVKANREKIIELLTELDTQTPQIQIEARVVEARSTWKREIGVQWGIGASASTATGNPTGLVFPSNIDVAGGATDNQTPVGGIVGSPNFAVNLPATVGTGTGGALGLTFGSVGGNFNLSLRLSAAEESGIVRIVSAPKVTVLNNIKAEIEQGVSIPIQVISAAGTQTQFVRAELRLTVTPHVSQRDCSIQMDVEVTKDEPDFVNTGARGDPTILTKKVTTTMLVSDGETTVIGGIYTRNTGRSVSKIPLLGDIPILGYFFRHKAENDDRSEVLVFITPKITNKASLRCEVRPR
jgi:type IV pilus assembly protein PilQ